MIKNGFGKWRIGLSAALIVFSGWAQAAFHQWQITEVYSNASGTVQFIELTALNGGQQFLFTGAGGQHSITSSSGGTTNTFLFPNNLPGDTAGHKMLIGTSGFAALGIVTPDYTVPNNFLFATNGTLLFAEFADTFSYATLPSDNVSSLSISVGTRVVTTTTNSPTNFSGATGSASPPGPPRIVTATPGNASITLGIAPPIFLGSGPFTPSYFVYCEAPGQTPHAVLNAGATTVINGLVAGATYDCLVGAGNNVGASPPATVSVTPFGAPGAPVIGTAIPGNSEAFIFFAPPASNGGAAITSYTATCNSGALNGSGIGSVSPITVSGLTNALLYSCSVTATNIAGTGAASATVDVTPQSIPLLTPVAAFSRKTHTGVGDFDLPIERGVAITGPVSVEPRTSGSGHTIVFVFNAPVTSYTTLSVTPVGTVSATATASKELVVTLIGVPDNQRVTISLGDVNGVGVNVDASMGFLVGDVSNSRSVNAGDISSVKARQNPTIDATNFKFDLNTSGSINSTDVSTVKSRSGVVLLP